MIDITLSADEIVRITGGYKRPGDQLRALRDQGFYRARIGKVAHEVILERAHYDAVCAGAVAGQQQATGKRPTLRSVT
jgi:hypothetical protein